MRRLWLLLAALVAGLLVIGLLVIRDDADTTSPPTQETGGVSAAEPDGRSSNMESVGTAPLPSSQRESATAESVETSSEGDAAPLQEGPRAMLIVRTVDKVSGAPLARVRISVSQTGIQFSASKLVFGSTGTIDTSPRTGVDGQAEFDLPAGIEIDLFADGEAADAGRLSRRLSALSPGERRQITLELPSGVDLHYFGRVVQREGQTPIAGARIEVRGRAARTSKRDGIASEKPARESGSAKLMTDSEGRFDLWLRSWEEPDLEIQAPGYGTVLLQIGTGHDSPERAKVVLLSRSATLHARLTDAGGVPLADGELRLWVESYYASESDHGGVYIPSPSELDWRGQADPQGLCVMTELLSGVPFHVEILREGSVVKKDLPTLSLEPGEVREIEWSVGSGCRVEGSVVDQDGKSVEGITVWLMRADFQGPAIFEPSDAEDAAQKTGTTAEGRFSFSDVSPGNWWIGPAATRDDGDEVDADAIAPFAQYVEVAAGASRQEVLLRVHRGLYIHGTVLDPAGNPAPPTYVWAATDVAGWIISAQSASDGSFSIGPLLPGRYQLVAHGGDDADSDPVEAQGGDTAVVLRLRKGGTIQGTVIDDSGKGCTAEILYCLREDAFQGLGMLDAQGDGTFVIRGLQPGTYDLAVNASGQRAGVLRGILVEAGRGTRDLVITLAQGSTLRLRYAGTEGYLNYRILSQGTTVGGDGVPAGGVSETVVPSGHLLIECHWPGADPETREIDIAPGEDKVLAFGGRD